VGTNGRNRLPSELARLLSAASVESREGAWRAFVVRHSRLLLKVSHETARGYDGAMDHYAYILERLREDEFRRLRRYEPDGRTKFTTWLVVVARRLCLDHRRHVYGRSRRADDEAVAQGEVRRRLVDFVMEEVDLEQIANDRGNGADAAVRRREQHECLQRALAALTDSDRLALRLRFEDEVPVADIAEVLDVPTVFHVYRRISKTLARLREELEKDGLEGPVP